MITDFVSLDQFTQTVIVCHQILNKLGYLSAVHIRQPSDVFVCIGGFKNMYPFVSKITGSNILDLEGGRRKAGTVFGYAFRVLN